MITQRQFIKSESPVALGASPFCSLGRRTSTSSTSGTLSSATAIEMPMKLEERLNELESNAVRALLSLGEAFVNQSTYKTPAVKKQPETFACIRPLQPHQQQQQPFHSHPVRSVIVKAEPAVTEESQRNNLQQRSPLALTTAPVTLQPISSVSTHQHQHNSFSREERSINNGLNLNYSSQQMGIKLAPTTAGINPSSPPLVPISSSCITNSTITSPISIQPVVSTVSSSSSPMISTIFYQIPATGTVSSTSGTQAHTVMSPSFTIIPAPNGRAVIPLPMVATSNGSPLVKIEPGTGGTQATQNGTPVNWNNLSNFQLVKVPRNGVEANSVANGLAAFNAFKALPVTQPQPNSSPIAPVKGPAILPCPSKGETKSLLSPPPPPPTSAAGVTGNDGKAPTKSRARRRSQSTTKGQPRTSRVSSGSSDVVVSSSVEGLPNIVVDGYEISREIWAKAFLQNDIIHAAGTLFNALFSTEEIKNCTLNGRNGTRQLCPEKRQAIFRIVAWMKNKCQDPYSFNTSPEETKLLSREEQMMIEKKVFVERRYQTSRKIRDMPMTSCNSSPASATSPPLASSTVTSPNTPTSIRMSPPLPSSLVSPVSSMSASKKSATSSDYQRNHNQQQRRNSGSFSSICSSTEEDKAGIAGIPKIALLQSSEIIANYFQSSEPLPLPPPKPVAAVSLINNHTHDGPPPMKMQKVGS